MRVSVYSPSSVAEFAIALLLSLNRKIHKAYNRTREGNFLLDGLIGFDLHGKRIGVIGTGKIGQIFMTICHGFGMEILCSDMYPNQPFADSIGARYTTIEEILSTSDVISLHCPLTEETTHLICKKTIDQMKKGIIIINTARGTLFNTQDVIQGLKDGTIGGIGMDVYEHEEHYFFRDHSKTVI